MYQSVPLSHLAEFFSLTNVHTGCDCVTLKSEPCLPLRHLLRFAPLCTRALDPTDGRFVAHSWSEHFSQNTCAAFVVCHHRSWLARKRETRLHFVLATNAGLFSFTVVAAQQRSMARNDHARCRRRSGRKCGCNGL